MEATRVLVVEDDPSLRATIVRGLRQNGFDVVSAADGRSALELLSGPEAPVDVIVLDIGLPDSDGRDVCQALRAKGVNAPVLFLTARGLVGDLLSGFAAGGDDYLAKPFHFAELLARLAALARRATPVRARPEPHLHLDPSTHALSAAGTQIALTPTEYRILAALLGAGEQVVRRRELVSAAWPTGAIVHDNTLDQYMARVRRKLATVPDAVDIVTVHGVGYRLAQSP